MKNIEFLKWYSSVTKPETYKKFSYASWRLHGARFVIICKGMAIYLFIYLFSIYLTLTN